MSNSATVLAVDIGTSSARALEFNAAGQVLAVARRGYPVISGPGGMEEQDPGTVWAAVQHVIGEAITDPNRIRAVSFSSQMYGVFAVDKDGRPLGNNILWSDSRALGEAGEAKQSLDSAEVARVTGCPVSSIYPRYKLRWLRKHASDMFWAAHKFVSVKDYVIHELTGQWVTDPSLASASGLLDITRVQWEPSALEWAGVEPDRLPAIVSTTAQLPFTNAALRVQWGLADDVVIVPGGGDGPLANLGSGASRPGEVNVDLGTSGAVRVVVDAPPSASNGLWCYCLDDGLWVVGGILTNVGNAWDWVCSNLLQAPAQEDAFARAERLLADTPAGSEGLLFLPFLRAPRSPYWDDSLAGTIHGLRPEHSVGHIIRALVEALGYDLAVILGLLQRQADVVEPLRFTGGLTRNHPLAQVIADVAGREMVVPRSAEGSAGGAALLGLKAVGLIDRLEFTAPQETSRTYAPDPSLRSLYEGGLARYQDLVRHMQITSDHQDLIR